MKRQVESFDWASTPLGPREGWPQSLRIAVGICLSSRFPMFVWWGPQRINIYNDAYVPMLGDKHPRALGRPAEESWAEIWDVVGAQARLVDRGEATWNDCVPLTMNRHGYVEETWFTWSYSPIYDESGKVGGLYCAVTEETPRVLAERERDALLRQVDTERARLAQTFAQSPSFLAVLRGPTHVFEYVNSKYEGLLGNRKLVGLTVREAIPEVGTQGFFELLDRVYATGEPFVGNSVRVELERGGGERAEVFLDFVYQPVRDADGAVSGILAHGVDVTQRHIVERSLRESDRNFRDLADSMPQIVFAADPDGRVDYFNRQWYEYTGLPEGEVSFESWRNVHTPEGLAATMEAWPRALRTGQPYEIEYALRRHDGEFRWHLGRALPVRDEAGRIVRWYGTNTDIHDRKQIEEALEKALGAEQAARHDAELASRMKDEFLATLSHELRTPLNAILGWSHMLRRDGVTARDYQRAGDVIERNARAQAKIIEDLLDMSAIISGKVRLEVERIELASIVRAAIDTARPAADAKHIRLRTQVDSLPGAEMRGDPNRLQQVLWNLLSNALKFTPRNGQIHVTLRAVGGNAEICVSDSGQGIDPEFVPFVFDRFRQADASTTRRHGGLGLGLAIVKQLVEMHGGTVRASSEGEGRGATFVVSLPLAVPTFEPHSPIGEATVPGQVLTIAPQDCAALAGKRVLVVDDEPDARDLLREMLVQCGVHVETAGSSDEALAHFARTRFDLLVSDIGMPGEDGYRLLERVRAMPHGDLPAMALTAYARPEDRERTLAAGFQSHCAKPVEPARLMAMLAEMARR